MNYSDDRSFNIPIFSNPLICNYIFIDFFCNFLFPCFCIPKLESQADDLCSLYGVDEVVFTLVRREKHVLCWMARATTKECTVMFNV
jgi:hypothetical protein